MVRVEYYASRTMCITPWYCLAVLGTLQPTSAAVMSKGLRFRVCTEFNHLRPTGVKDVRLRYGRAWTFTSDDARPKRGDSAPPELSPASVASHSVFSCR